MTYILLEHIQTGCLARDGLEGHSHMKNVSGGVFMMAGAMYELHT